ncbi:MAG: zf-HC2 domain-containing protein [Anaerolineales bacterium]
MNTPLSSRELNRLSAYLDGALPPQEHARLETRLQQDPDLQHELDTLRHTRLILRAAPRPRLPRNFTLSPEMVAARPSFLEWFRPTMQWSAALAFVFLLFTIAGQRWLMPPAIAPTMEMPTAPRIVSAAPTTTVTQEKALVATPENATQPTPTGQEMALPFTSMMQADTPTISTTLSMTVGTPISAPLSTTVGTPISTTAVIVPPPEQQPTLPDVPPAFPWRSLQIALGVTAIVCALAALLAGRRK